MEHLKFLIEITAWLFVFIGLSVMIGIGYYIFIIDFYNSIYKKSIKWIGFLFKGRLVLLDRPLSEDNTETYQALSLKSFEAWKSIIIKAKK